jgi:hypothetical protein
MISAKTVFFTAESYSILSWRNQALSQVCAFYSPRRRPNQAGREHFAGAVYYPPLHLTLPHRPLNIAPLQGFLF